MQICDYCGQVCGNNIKPYGFVSGETNGTVGFCNDECERLFEERAKYFESGRNFEILNEAKFVGIAYPASVIKRMDELYASVPGI